MLIGYVFNVANEKKQILVVKTSILLCHPSIYAQALQKSGLGARESLSTPGLFLAALGGRWMTFQIMGRGDCNGNNCKSGKVDTILKRTQISQQFDHNFKVEI